MERINKMSRNLNTITGLGLSLLISASSVLVQGCKDKPEVTDTTKANKISYNLFSFDGEEKDLTGKNGSLKFSAIGNNGSFRNIYLGVTDVTGAVTVYDGKELKHLDMKAGKATNDKPEDFSFQLSGGRSDRDDGIITHIVPQANSDKAAIGVRELGRYLTDLLGYNHKGGVIVADGDVLRAGLRNTSGFFPDLTYNRDYITALTANENQWLVFFNNNSRASAISDWNSVEPAKPYIDITEVISAAAHANGIVYLATQKGDVFENIGNNPVLIIKASELDIVGSHKAITSLAIIGDYLLVGMGTIPGVANSGGVYAYNLTTKIGNRYGLGQSVRSIAVSPDNDVALIATDKGMIVFADNEFASSNFSTVFTADKANENRPAFDSKTAIPADLAKGVIGFGFGPNNMVYVAIPGAPIQKIKITNMEREDSTK